MLTLNAQASAAQQLKDHTSENHRAVESVLAPIIESIDTTGSYAELLKTFYGFYYPLEQNIEPFIDEAVVTDIQLRRKSKYILEDLGALQERTADIPMAIHLPRINDTAAAMGALYVLEGSTLGGKTISRMLSSKTALQLQPNQLRFFNGYGRETGPMWISFVQALNLYAIEEQQVLRMIEAADQTFLHLKQWFTFQKHERKERF